MKKLLIPMALVITVLAAALLIAGCTAGGSKPEPTSTPEPTYCLDPPAAGSPEYDVERWLANEIVFTSDKEYDDPVFTVTMDAVFTHMYTGQTLTVPCFWNGGTEWILRYALTEAGPWKFMTVCSDGENSGLTGKEGLVRCTEYTGNLDIYKHGFVKVVEGEHRFVYADGTPFFYLGDTHWTLPLEDIDSYGGDIYGAIDEATAKEYGITSMFRYIIDYRVSQGFTVIQSQQLGTWNGASGNTWMGDTGGTIFNRGVNQKMLEKFKHLDRYFKIIADAGLVHAHSQFTYPDGLRYVYPKRMTDEKIDMLCRYWVARYSAYPVMWATVQEGDNDHYEIYKAEKNPWKVVFAATQKHDPYDHPASCHQENVEHTRVENSAFKDLEGYNFFAAQAPIYVHKDMDPRVYMVKEYWNNEKGLPVVDYEGRYDHFWCGTTVSRGQGWYSFLNGMFGYGYGIQPIWSIFWSGNEDTSATSDEVETYRKDYNWLEGLMDEGGKNMSYMRKFFEEYEWWKMVPCFDGNDYYTPKGSDYTAVNYSVSTINGNEVYIGYFFSNSYSGKLGVLKGMNNAKYTVRWFDPRTGEYGETATVKIKDGTYEIPAKPDTNDWVIVVKLAK